MTHNIADLGAATSVAPDGGLAPEDGNFLVYDGACPFCQQYVRLLRLRESLGPVTLLSARDDHPVVRALLAEGHDLNEGIALVYCGELFFGEACMVRLAALSSPVGVFNRFNRWMFASPRRAAFWYPLLKVGRRVLLKLLGRPLIPAQN